MERRQDSSSAKDSLLRRWLNKTSAGSTGIPRRPDGAAAPLSLGQQRLWFLQQLYPENPFYHFAEVYRLRGPLLADLLISAFRMVAQRHDILRTTFAYEQDRPVQVVAPEVELDYTFHDLQRPDPGQVEAEAEALAVREARRPIDLKAGPLVRITLIRLAEEEHLLLLNLHHMITDEWSMQVLRRELAAAYRGLKAGESVHLEPLPIQYADFAYWQRSQPVNPAHLAYWKQKLAGELPVLKLPADRPQPARPSFRGAYSRRRYPADLVSRLKERTREANTTAFVWFLTAFKVLLYRYSHQEDILVGTPFTNRDQVALEKLIGFFNETLVLRSDLSGDPTFLDLVEQVRATVLEAFSHKSTPFDTLVRELRPDRQLSSNPLFQVMFLYNPAAENTSPGPELSMEHMPFDLGISRFDLTLYLAEEGEELSVIFEYATDLFEPYKIERMHGHLRQLLEGIAANPRQHISALPLLTPFEWYHLVVKMNDTWQGMPEVPGIHFLFEEQARQKVDHPAIRFQNRQLTYGQLNEQADRVAAQLATLELGPNPIIGLYTERSPEMITGLLGILKVGGAYLPLDPEYPADRIDFMLRDAGVKVVVTQAALKDALSGHEVRCVVLDDPALFAAAAAPAARVEVHPKDRAYIIYTSGSTGRPKGVQVTHYNLIHSTAARFRYYREPPEAFLLLSSFAFDSSVAGIFWTLCSGGTLVLQERRTEQDLDVLASVVAGNGITHTLLLPSLYALLLEHAPPEQLAALRTVIVAGEACSSSLCRRHFQTLPQVKLYNEYGPTEATVWCTAHQIRPQDAHGSVPIGQPIANTEIYILDRHLQPVPFGVAGELYVGGAGVAPGYLNRPELTQERFIPNHLTTELSDRLYRTGDLARYRADGLIDFLGRADQQVKIRGYRIELEEIGEALRQLPGVREAVVVVRLESNTDDQAGGNEIEQLAQLLARLDPAEADRLLRSVEQLSDAELDYLLTEKLSS